ncbi:MAG: trypsin-like peptidase domain-containing protein [Acidobacteria bacterium]|nr:trypsin-like peptidase domain-containing protein [Acidobacteriota bacterium]
MPSTVSIRGAALLFVVVFGGVFAALWLDRTLDRQAAITSARDSFGSIVPAGMEIDAAPFDFSEAARRVIPSVVSIDTAIQRESFMGAMRLQSVGSGSGVVVRADGYIITNAHVVRDPRSRAVAVAADSIRVHTSDGKGYDATVVGFDELSDIAVIKVDANNLVPAAFGDSDDIEVGEWVLAVGNQLGFDNSVSVGIVSSKGRWFDTQSDSILIDAIQTDATINRGNSGGALCNSQGEVIGINSSIATLGGVSSGVGFAIPSNHVRRVVSDILEHGVFRYAILGINLIAANLSLAVPRDRALISQLAGFPNPPTYGLVVAGSDPNLPAGKAGIGEYDVIMEIDGRRMNSNVDYVRTMMAKRPGDKVDLKVWSRGETKQITVTLAAHGG